MTDFKNYEEFENAKIQCRKCPIGPVYDCVVPSTGNKINPKVVIIGEAPGREEIEQGEPFVGKSGKLLRDALNSAGFKKSNSLITNSIPCRPENNKFPSDTSIVKNCVDMWLKNEVRLLMPDYILLIGGKALKFVLNENGIMSKRGQWFKIVIKPKTNSPNAKEIYVMPTYHPSFVLRKQYMQDGKQIEDDFRNDITTVGLKAGFRKTQILDPENMPVPY